MGGACATLATMFILVDLCCNVPATSIGQENVKGRVAANMSVTTAAQAAAVSHPFFEKLVQNTVNALMQSEEP